jgi:hypothetical protein
MPDLVSGAPSWAAASARGLSPVEQIRPTWRCATTRVTYAQTAMRLEPMAPASFVHPGCVHVVIAVLFLAAATIIGARSGSGAGGGAKTAARLMQRRKADGKLPASTRIKGCARTNELATLQFRLRTNFRSPRKGAKRLHSARCGQFVSSVGTARLALISRSLNGVGDGHDTQDVNHISAHYCAFILAHTLRGSVSQKSGQAPLEPQ